MKKLTKKQQIRLSIIGGVLVLAVLIGVTVLNNRPKETAEAENIYQITKVEEAAPLLFKGSVKAEKTQEFYYDQSLGTITHIGVTDAQEISDETVILSYENSSVQEQADEQDQSLARANLAVQNAQESLDLAYEKQNEAVKAYNEAVDKANAQEETSEEGQMKKQELLAQVDSLEASVDSQKEMVLQAQQALESANLDLTSANEMTEKIRGKVTHTITAGMKGIAYINEKGKSDPTVPVVTIVSPSTVIEATVSEYDYDRLQAEQKVTIQPTNGDSQIDGTITQVDKLPETASQGAEGGASAASASYRFQVKPAKDLQYGYTVQITLPINELRIPEKSLVKDGEKRFVYLVKAGKAHKQEVKLTEKNGLFIVTEGLKAEDEIITEPDDQLKDGQEVAVD